MRRVVVMDTSVMLVLLQLPGYDHCGPRRNKLDSNAIKRIVDDRIEAGSTIVLPLAVLIEVGSHIANSLGDRYAVANSLVEIVKKGLRGELPWAHFNDQFVLWTGEPFTTLLDEWPSLAVQQLSFADATIKRVAEYYSRISAFQVEIFTGDLGLKSFEPSTPPVVPRRRQ